METLILQPPNDSEMTVEQYRMGSIFLAGTIEMGTGEDWQPKAIKALTGKVGAIYNPRRDDWDSGWEQTISNPQFSQQVNWELDHIERALRGRGVVYFYFDPKSKSPITLMELGLVCGLVEKYQDTTRVIVCCPSGFWRRGNVEIICARQNVPLYDDFDESIEAVLKVLRINELQPM